MARAFPFTLVTDTASDLPLAWCQEHNVSLVPLHLRRRGHDIRDVYDPESRHASPCYRVSPPMAQEYEEAFRQAAQDGAEGVMCVTVSNALSTAYRNAVTAAGHVADEFHVAVVDSRSGSVGEGLLVQAMAAARNVGMSLLEAGSYAQALASHITCVAMMPPSVSSLRGTGPVHSARTTLRRRLGLSTLVAFGETGSLVNVGTFRNLHAPAERIARLMRLDSVRDGAMVRASSYAGNPYALHALARALEGQGEPVNGHQVFQASGSVTAFAGSGAAAVAYMPVKYLAGPVDGVLAPHEPS